MIRRPDCSSDFPDRVTLFEVGARDGLQNESSLPTQTKVDFINLLSLSGLKHIEAGSFVSAKRVPQMADSLNVMRAIARQDNITYSALTPNIQGFEMA